jgi:hypothetical protein
MPEIIEVKLKKEKKEKEWTKLTQELVDYIGEEFDRRAELHSF